VGRRTVQPSGIRPGPRHDGFPRGTRSGATGAPVRKKFIDYPRAGRRGWTRWIPSWRLITAAGAFGVTIIIVLVMSMYANAQVKPPAESTRAQATVVYYSDGKTEIGRMQQENRTIVTLEQIPEHVRNAVLAAEDRTFYSNQGVSWTGTLRAAWSNSRGGSLQGGSTITQQYVKNAILDNRQRTVSRKLNEFFIALKINRQMPKDEILVNYLNTIFFGRNAYGIEAASQAYFHKSVSDLTPSEGAFIAGIINGPNLYDPANGEESTTRAEARWTFVADGMAEMNWVTAAERAEMAFPTVQPPKSNAEAVLGDQNQYLLQMVRQELTERGVGSGKNFRRYTQKELDTGGFRIITTFDRSRVVAGWKAVRAKLGDPETWPEGTQAAMASVDPSSGAVVAIYGGDGISRSSNAATQDTAQAGSTFKPFTLIAALEGDPDRGVDPINLRSRYDGHSPLKVDGYTVRNFGNEQFKDIDLITATEHSVNTVYVALNSEVGPAHTREVAIRAGIPEHTGGLDDNLSNVLGASSPHPIDMADAYATLANGGTQHDWYVVQEIRNANGALYTHPDTGEPQFSSDVVADATYAMQQVVKSGSGAYASRLYYSHPLAGKTGTSDDNKSAWFVGFTPQLATAVAMYRRDPDPPHGPLPLKGFKGFSSSGMTGGSLPVRVWTEYMTAALKGKPRVELPDPVYGGIVINPEPTTQVPTTTDVPTTTEPPTTEPGPTTEPPTSGTEPSPSDPPTSPGGPSDSGTLGPPTSQAAVFPEKSRIPG
jgi:membrane peptidoglycan carboxypeptidase